MSIKMMVWVYVCEGASAAGGPGQWYKIKREIKERNENKEEKDDENYKNTFERHVSFHKS